MKKAIAALFLAVCFSLSLGQAHLASANNMSSAQCMVTIEASTGRILYGHNIHTKRPMASVTKIVTAITVLENCKNLEAKIVVPKKAEGIEGSSIYLQAGESISVLDLLYGLMLQSGNDCAAALALTIGGSIEAFSEMMNQTALRAGATNSNFVNPHGLHDDKHYTTAYDLAAITAYAMKNSTFKEIVASKLRKIERTRENGITMIVNKNKLLKTFDGADGVKTGFTKKAGRCLVASATRNGMQVISVVLNCGPMFEDCASLMNAAFKEFSLKKVDGANETLTQIKIENCKKETINAGLKQDLYFPLRASETLISEFVLNPELKAPLKKGTALGKLNYKLNGKIVATQDLVALEDAPALTLADFLKDILNQC